MKNKYINNNYRLDDDDLPVRSRMKLPLGLMAQLLFCVLMFGLYGFTLTTCTLFICLLILRVIYYKPGFMMNGEYLTTWPVYLLLGGAVSITTLYTLYNPAADVYTNVDTHFLKLSGFTAKGDTVSLLNDGKPTTAPPLWKDKTLGAYAGIVNKEGGLYMVYKLCQPIYQKTGDGDSLLNAATLPVFDKTFTLHLKSGVGLEVTINDYKNGDAPRAEGMGTQEKVPEYSSRVQVRFLKKGEEPVILESGFGKFITRSLPLSSVINDIPVPDNFDFSWDVLNGITLLRPIGGMKPKDIEPGIYHLSITLPAMDNLMGLSCNGKNYTVNKLARPSTIKLTEGKAIRIGTGLTATPYIRPYAEGGHLTVKLDKPLRQRLPYEKDSTGMQSVLVTSSLETMAGATTTGSIYYPVFPGQPEKSNFKFALQYLPERCTTPFKCKIQLLGDEKFYRPGGNTVNGATLLSGGDKFTLENDSRYLCPDFELVNMRNTAPFDTTKGYLLVFAVLLGAGVSFLASRGKCETRGETCLWLGLMALITIRAFIAWRTVTFPPLADLSEASFAAYGKTSYTFWATLVLIFGLITLPLVLYKTWLLNKEKEDNGKHTLVSRLCRRVTSFLPRTVNQSPGKEGSRSIYGKYWFPVLLSVIIIIFGLGVSMFFNTKRFLYVFFPVLSFVVSEWLYIQRSSDESRRDDIKVKVIRYVCMIMSVGIPLVFDSGFGIVYLLFLLLYNALDINYDLKYHTDDMRGLNEAALVKIKKIKLWFMFGLLTVFLALMLRGPHVVSLMYRHFLPVAIVVTLLVGYLCYTFYKLSKISGYAKKWSYSVIGMIVFFLVVFVSLGEYALSEHRHLLYRSEIHIKDLDDILMENEVDSRDMERLFEASQNQWYLGFYMSGRSLDKSLPFETAYDLREHFNKGVSWETQKTDAVLSRYVIGEHSVWTVYTLILLFALMFVSVFVSARGKDKYTLIGCGALLLLLCQSIFITMAVTNRFIFFGQDYPLLSQHSLLTLCMTYTMLCVAMLSTVCRIDGKTGNKPYNRPDWKSVTVLGLIFALVIVSDPSITDGTRDFKVGNAIKLANMELSGVNAMLEEYQKTHHDELARCGAVRHFAPTGKKNAASPRAYQRDYSKLMEMFDKDKSVGDSLIAMSRRPGSGVSPFTASLYKIYRDKLSKHNQSSDIIHLKAESDGNLHLTINRGYYTLITPESNQKAWTGNILPSETGALAGALTLATTNTPVKMGSGAERIDRNNNLFHYNYPMVLCKLDNSWVPGGKDVLVARSVTVPLTVKNGARQYALTKTGRTARYLVLQNDDYLTMERDENVGNREGIFHLKGGVDKYFARNMLVNGRRMMVYPLGETFMYPYHASNMMSAVYSGDDPERRNKNVELTLNYTLTGDLYTHMSKFTKNRSEPDARGLIVADGNGHIKAMVTAKNANRDLGYREIDPNDTEEMNRVMDNYYLNGDYRSEERTFGDLNLLYLKNGPGSSVKPITFDAVASQVAYDWKKLRLYVNIQDQGLKTRKRPNSQTLAYIYTPTYSHAKLGFQSLYGDEIGNNGYTDIVRYMEKSSNYFNSLMVYMGFYKPDYLLSELENVEKGRKSDLFKPYRPNAEYNFPAFTLKNPKGEGIYCFANWLTDDNMPRHDAGTLSEGYERNFGLLSDYPQNIGMSRIVEERNLRLTGNDPIDMEKAYNDYPFVFPQISYLPDRDRTSKSGARTSIRSTTLGGYPFRLTPLKMAEMYGRLFTQNRSFKLTLDPNMQQEFEPFVMDAGYEGNKAEYYDLLSNNLFAGMEKVTRRFGTARALEATAERLEDMGYHLYAKTGTISSKSKNGTSAETKLLAVIISKHRLHGMEKTDNYDKLLKNNRFYVMYFVNDNGMHNYNIINASIRTIVANPEFIKYMNDK